MKVEKERHEASKVEGFLEVDKVLFLISEGTNIAKANWVEHTTRNQWCLDSGATANRNSQIFIYVE